MRTRLLSLFACLLLMLGTPMLARAQSPAPGPMVAMQQAARKAGPYNMTPHSSTNDSGAGFWVIFVPIAAVVFIAWLAQVALKDKTYN